MATSIIENSGNLFTVKLEGKLKKEELELFQNVAAQAIAQMGQIKILIFADGFAGWERADWGDISFMMEHDDDIGKIAVLGEERWREDLLMFLGAGLRSAGVAFFSLAEEDLARAWLEAG